MLGVGGHHSGQVWGEAPVVHQQDLVEPPRQIGIHGHDQASGPEVVEAEGDWEMSRDRESWGHQGKEIETEERCQDALKVLGQRHH